MHLVVREHPSERGIYYVYDEHSGRYIWQDNKKHRCIHCDKKNEGAFKTWEAAYACAEKHQATHPDETIFAIRHKDTQVVITLSSRTGRRFYETRESALRAIKSGNTYRKGKPTDYEIVEYRLEEVDSYAV